MGRDFRGEAARGNLMTSLLGRLPFDLKLLGLVMQPIGVLK
jgi:hypothetical protein